MNKIDATEAKNIVNSNIGNYTAFFWYSTECPVCEQFLEVELPKVESEMNNWTMYKINFDDHVKENGVLFEPHSMPMGYFFKGSSRLFVGDGFAPSKEVIQLLTELESPGFKTDKEIEQEQLNQLD
jgi:hypothetical protein